MNKCNHETITLAIESSCDETAAAVLTGGREILSSVIATQIPVHQKYGGVVPEIASRQHIIGIMPVIDEALHKADVALADIDQVAVTYGPGLVGALLVGVSAAKALAFSLNVPLIGVNHLEGHIFANFLSHPALEPPFMALVVSGGHTSLVDVRGYNDFSLMGETRDDAAGEAFDKIARVMKLPYPGGPEIDKLAQRGNPCAIDFPQALSEEGNYEFSFSGLKSAVLNYLHNAEQKREEVNLPDVAASFQRAVVEVLTHKAIGATKRAERNALVLAGGVAANSNLEKRLRQETGREGLKFYFPTRELCTDNAAMIACRGYYQAQAGKFSDLWLNAVPGLSLTSTQS
ncbi:MAG: tRNA (adenosine(37)-N6)-threonylcarbamoyltransferase complex transferase subunit TsaD [Selenomonadaceae bacterium]|nr:tRNA (adenosine(37)-N6)-threonylcarbamoyltransferase complex transferase subunit TsaD [Selenomonadaceae bacterium]